MLPEGARDSFLSVLYKHTNTERPAMSTTIVNSETAALSLEVLLQINVTAADPERLHKMTLLDSAIKDLQSAVDPKEEHAPELEA